MRNAMSSLSRKRENLNMEGVEREDPQEHKMRDRRALTDALEGKRELTWAIWASSLYRSHYLTEQGRDVAEWAVEVLRSFLGDDFLQRVRTAGVHHALLSGALLTTLWPEFDSRRVYED